jgi:hypothetical protein
MSGTPQFVYDERRGLFNYEALRSPLADNQFAQAAIPIIPDVISEPLTPEEIYLLLERLCELHTAITIIPAPLGQRELTSFDAVVSAWVRISF